MGVFIKGVLLTAGQPSPNGRIYPEEVLRKIADDTQQAVASRRLLGSIDGSPDGKIMLDKVSHVVTELRFEDGKLLGSVEVLPTAEGKRLLDMLDKAAPSKEIGLASVGIGKVDENNVVSDYKITEIVIDPKDKKGGPA